MNSTVTIFFRTAGGRRRMASHVFVDSDPHVGAGVTPMALSSMLERLPERSWIDAVDVERSEP